MRKSYFVSLPKLLSLFLLFSSLLFIFIQYVIHILYSLVLFLKVEKKLEMVMTKSKRPGTSFN